MTTDMDQTKHQLGLANLKAPPRKMIPPLLIVDPESTNLIDFKGYKNEFRIKRREAKC